MPLLCMHTRDAGGDVEDDIGRVVSCGKLDKQSAAALLAHYIQQAWPAAASLQRLRCLGGLSVVKVQIKTAKWASSVPGCCILVAPRVALPS